MSHALRVTLVIAAALAFAVPASAQEGQIAQAQPEATLATVNPAQSIMIQVPSAASLAFAVPSAGAEFDVASAFAVQANSRNVALMVVGGAGLILGAVIGGDEGTIIMIAGGGVALYGLWRYLR